MDTPEKPDTATNYWHLDKRINIGHILTTLTIAVGVILAWANHDARISALEQQDRIHTQIVAAAVTEVKDSVKSVQNDIRELRSTLIDILRRSQQQPRI